MTPAAWLWAVGCCALAACSVVLIMQLAKHKPADRVSDKWLDDNIRERRID